MVKMLMKLRVYLSGLYGTFLSSRRLIVFRDILSLILVHFILDLIISLFGVTCIVLLTVMLIHVLIIRTMFNRTLHQPGTILMLS